MDVWDLTRVMARRWWVVAPCLLATAAAALVVVRSLPTDYVVAASLVLAAAPQPADLGIRDGAESQVTPAAVIAELLQDAAVRDAVAGGGATSAYTAEAVGHVVRVIATSTDAGQVRPTAEAVLDAIPGAVVEREEALGVPPAARTTVEVIRRPAGAEPAAAPGAGFQAVGAALLRPAVLAENPVTPSKFTALLLAEAVQGGPAREHIAEQGLVATYEVEVDRDGPLLRLTATGPQEQRVLDTVDAVVTAMGDELAERQDTARVPAAQQVGVQPVVLPAQAQQRTGSPVGSLVAILGLGLVTSAALAVVVDRVVGSRADPQAGDGQPEPQPEPEPEPQAEPEPDLELDLDAGTASPARRP